MNRRDFLTRLGLGALAASVAPNLDAVFTKVQDAGTPTSAVAVDDFDGGRLEFYSNDGLVMSSLALPAKPGDLSCFEISGVVDHAYVTSRDGSTRTRLTVGTSYPYAREGDIMFDYATVGAGQKLVIQSFSLIQA